MDHCLQGHEWGWGMGKGVGWRREVALEILPTPSWDTEIEGIPQTSITSLVSSSNWPMECAKLSTCNLYRVLNGGVGGKEVATEILPSSSWDTEAEGIPQTSITCLVSSSHWPMECAKLSTCNLYRVLNGGVGGRGREVATEILPTSSWDTRAEGIPQTPITSRFVFWLANRMC